MFLHGLKKEKKLSIGFDHLLSFVDREMDFSKKKEFFSKSYLEGSRIIPLRFKSLSPLVLEREKEITGDHSEHVYVDPDTFHPFFFGSGITNGQYRKLHIRQSKPIANTNSFSDYLIIQKPFIELASMSETPDLHDYLGSEEPPKEGGSAIKSMVLTALYQHVEMVVREEKTEMKQKKGNKEKTKHPTEKYALPSIYVNFNSVLDLEIEPVEMQSFFQSLVDELNVSYQVDINLLSDRRSANFLIYMMESLVHQSIRMHAHKPKGQPVDEFLSEKVNLTFEVPIPGKKPILQNQRHVEGKKGGDIPQLTLFESIVVRMMINMNKVGFKIPFLILDEEDQIGSISRKAFIEIDPHGNISLSDLKIQSVSTDDIFSEKVRVAARRIQLDTTPRSENETMGYFVETATNLANVWMRPDSEDKKLFLSKLEKGEFQVLYRQVYDRIYRQVPKRAMTQGDTRGAISFHDLLSLLVVLEVTGSKGESSLKEVGFIVKDIESKFLMEKEDLGKEECCYLLGAAVAMVIKKSKNGDVVGKSFLRQTNIQNVKSLFATQYAIQFDQVDDHRKVGEIINKITPIIVKMEGHMTANERFAFLAGYLSKKGTGANA